MRTYDYDLKGKIGSYDNITQKVHCIHADSIAEISDCKVDNARQPAWVATHNRRSGDEADRWLGIKGGRKAVEAAATEGWSEGAELMERYAQQLLEYEDITVNAAMASRKRRKRSRGDNGMAVDMERVYNGQLETAWTRMKHVQKIQQSPRNVVVFIDVSTAASVSASSSLWRGALAFGITQYLIQAGYSVKVVGGAIVRALYEGEGSKDVTTMSCTVKEYDSHISPDHLALVSSVAFMRHYVFKAQATHPTKQVTSCYGSLADKCVDALPEDLKKDVEAGVRVLHVPSTTGDFQSAKLSLLKVIEQLKAHRTDNRVGR